MRWSYRFGVRPGLGLLVAVFALCVLFMALEPRAEAGVGDGEGVAFASGVDIAAAVGQKNEIRIVHPAIGAHISGKIRIKLKVGQKIKRVFVFIDDRYFASGPPYPIFWNSATASNGPHRITVAAARTALSPDALFLASRSQTTTKFFVQNKPIATRTPTSTPSPTPDPTPTPPPNALNLLSGSYSGCTNGVGAGCAKGDYRANADATVSTASSTLTTPTGNFTSADVGKHGVAVQWSGASPYSGGSCNAWPGWGCWNGVSCEFTVASVNSATSINVTRGSGCGSSGIGFTASANAYWALYTDDTTALSNAIAAAQSAGKSLYVPANYVGGIGGSPNFYSGFNLQCANGGTFYNPHLSPGNANTWIMRILGGSGYTITGCTFSGTEPTNAAWQDVDRKFDLAVAIEGGASNVSFTHNTVKNFWGTYEVATSRASNVTIDTNLLQNCAYYGVQLAETAGSSSVTNNTFTDCNYGSEDGGTQPTGIDQYQQIQSNTLQVGPNGGTGYNKTQTALSLGTQGSVLAEIGKACSGVCTNTSQYTGVTFTGNTVSGAGSVIYGPPSTTPTNGASVYGNTCINGCSYH